MTEQGHAQIELNNPWIVNQTVAGFTVEINLWTYLRKLTHGEPIRIEEVCKVIAAPPGVDINQFEIHSKLQEMEI